jgi:hypothetical protein
VHAAAAATVTTATAAAAGVPLCDRGRCERGEQRNQEVSMQVHG